MQQRHQQLLESVKGFIKCFTLQSAVQSKLQITVQSLIDTAINDRIKS